MIWSCQASEHDADHGEADESRGSPGIALEVAGQSAVAADPGQGSFDDPAFGQDDEAVQFIAFDDLQLPGAGLCDGGGRLRPLVAGVGEDAFDEREHAPGATIENQSRTVPVLHVGRMNDDIQEETERIDEDVPLATRDLLARIKALRVERGAPF
jgi:hypothetical protein